MTKERAQWGSRVGLILAMAGNAVGLGNFLRFPVQATQNGGGTFMIPYFISFILLGIPLMWIEWGVGRHGGLKGHGSVPGMFHSLWNHPVAKYMGVVGLFTPLVVLIYYCYIESWTLAWTWFSVTGATRGLDQAQMTGFLRSYQDVHDAGIHGFWVPFGFYFVTIFINFAVVMKGLSGGIEKLAKIGMPILFGFAAILVIRVLTLPPQTLADGSTFSPLDGLNFMYTPEWSALKRPTVWLAAAGQIFFTLSVGMGTLQAYASYLRKDDDLTLSGIATAATNETAEVVLGGSLAIPALVTFFGITGATGAIAIAQGGTYDVGFAAMPLVFNKLPGGPLIAAGAGFMWFGLLFFAGITSSVSMATPTTSFLEENFGFTRKKAGFTVAGVAVAIGLLHIIFYYHGFLDEWDYWAGTFGLVILAMMETILFVWVFGPSPWQWRRVWSDDNRMWNELHDGAAWRIPSFYKFIMTYITPTFLAVMMVWWAWTDAYPILKMDDIDPAEHATRWWSRGVMLALLLFLMILTRIAWKRREARGEEL